MTNCLKMSNPVNYAGVPDNRPTDDVRVFDWLFAADISTELIEQHLAASQPATARGPHIDIA